MKVSEHLNPAFSVIQQAVEAGKFASGYERYVENVIKEIGRASCRERV